MKAVIQKVHNARIEVEGKVVAAIGLGLCVFVGVHVNDTQRDVDYIARKIVNLRMYDDAGRTVSVKHKGYEVLCRSQITLCAHVQGFKVNHYRAMSPDTSRPVYYNLVKALQREYCKDKVKDGQFQVHSTVHISNDGPWTFILDSHEVNWNQNKAKPPLAERQGNTTFVSYLEA